MERVGGAIVAPSKDLVENARWAFSTGPARSMGHFRDRRPLRRAQDPRSADRSTPGIPQEIPRRRDHDFAFVGRRVPGSRIVGPLSVRRCA